MSSSGANTPEKSAAIWSNDRILIKLSCWGIFRVKQDKRNEKQKQKRHDYRKCNTSQRDEEPGKCLHNVARLVPSFVCVTKHFISFKEAFGIQAAARTRSLWMLHIQAIMEKCFITPDRRCFSLYILVLTVVTVYDRIAKIEKNAASSQYLFLFCCWACHRSHRYTSSPRISIKHFLCD